MSTRRQQQRKMVKATLSAHGLVDYEWDRASATAGPFRVTGSIEGLTMGDEGTLIARCVGAPSKTPEDTLQPGEFEGPGDERVVFVLRLGDDSEVAIDDLGALEAVT